MILSKCYDPADYDQFKKELDRVRMYGIDGQHRTREWEYSLALRAIDCWTATQESSETSPHPFNLYDVGGAGSRFKYMVPHALERSDVFVIDPAEPAYFDGPAYTLEQWTCAGTELADVITCLSVLEHVDDYDRFLYHLSCLVAPGGLLVLTVDFCDDDTRKGWPDDTYHFHWMRKRIFNRSQMERLRRDFRDLQLFDFGDAPDWTYVQPIEDGWGYTFASLVLQKRS